MLVNVLNLLISASMFRDQLVIPWLDHQMPKEVDIIRPIPAIPVEARHCQNGRSVAIRLSGSDNDKPMFYYTRLIILIVGYIW